MIWNSLWWISLITASSSLLLAMFSGRATSTHAIVAIASLILMGYSYLKTNGSSHENSWLHFGLIMGVFTLMALVWISMPEMSEGWKGWREFLLILGLSLSFIFSVNQLKAWFDVEGGAPPRDDQ